MRKLFILFVLSTAFSSVFAQFPMGGGGRPGGGNAQNMNMGHFYGKIVDKSNKGLEAVTVQLLGNRFDTVAKKMKEAILNTTITRANGEFSFENLPLFGNFKLKMSALGYKNLEQTIKFDIKMPPQGGGNTGGAPGQMGGGATQMLGMIDKDLGNIKMEEDATNLGNVTVVSSAATQLQLGIDRKIFTVDKNLSSTGQTAVEVMKNIPGLNVDIDGNVTMRNAAPTIFIDGRPTTLTLDQIPSDIIDKVEMITNPSAKYDASGGNAGILNIVLKKNKKTGYNGGIRAGIDSRGKPNVGGDLNLRQNKINLSLNALVNQRKSISTGVLDRTNIDTLGKTLSSVHNGSNSTNEGQFGFIRGGLDYFIDNRNTISIAANYVKGAFDNDQQQRVDSTVGGVYSSYNYINALSNANFKNFGSQLSFKHNFAKNGHDISADLNYNSSNNDNVSNVNTQNYYTNGGTKGLPLRQQTIGNGTNRFLTIQADYENPLTEDSKIEAGVRGAIRNFTNLSDQYFYDHSSGKYVLVPTISNKYKFDDQVYAAYGTYTFRVKRFNFQLGLRVESSQYTGTLLKQNGADSSQFNVNYPLSVFPSMFVTYKLTDKEDFQLNYSRRVNRPNFFQLMPFPDYSDPQNINIGNPNLNPEFTDSYEISYSNNHARGANFLASLFFKYNTNLITRYTYEGPNPVSPTGDKAYFNTYVNSNNSYVGGLELTERLPLTKWWDFTINMNLFYSQLNTYIPKTATAPEQNISNEMWSWFAKTNNTFKVAKGWSVQLSGDYQAKTILPPGTGGGGRNFGGGGGGGMMFGGGPQSTSQGYNYPRYGWDLAIRKDWTWKNGQSGSLTVGMNDIFRTQLFKSYSESIYFTQVNERRRDPQVLRANFSYRFGKFDASLFKRKNTKADQGGGTDMMGGNQ
jgi:outer membrane receptor protein involved in Fe transport